jgi:hypothetical protein
VKCVEVVPVGRVGVWVGVVKDGVDPVLVYCDEVEPVGNVVFGIVVFVVDPVDVEKLGVEPVLVYCDDVEPVGRVGVGVPNVVVVTVIEGFNVVRVVPVGCGVVVVELVGTSTQLDISPAPTVGCSVPAGHSVGKTEPGEQKLPCGQSSGITMPSFGQKLPAGHI